MINLREYFKLIVFRDYWETWQHMNFRNHNAMDRSICFDYMRYQLEKGTAQEDFDDLKKFYHNAQVCCDKKETADWIQEIKNAFALSLEEQEGDGYDLQETFREIDGQAEWSVQRYEKFLAEVEQQYIEKEESIWTNCE